MNSCDVHNHSFLQCIHTHFSTHLWCSKLWKKNVLCSKRRNKFKGSLELASTTSLPSLPLTTNYANMVRKILTYWLHSISNSRKRVTKNNTYLEWNVLIQNNGFLKGPKVAVSSGREGGLPHSLQLLYINLKVLHSAKHVTPARLTIQWRGSR